MNKRNTIIVVFRVVAIFVLFLGITAIPTAYATYSLQRFGGESSMLSAVTRMLSIVGIPFGMAWVLWNRGGWIADKILAPFNMDQLWEDSVEEIETTDTPIPSQTDITETSITHLNRDEIETIVFTAIGIWTISNALPDVIRWLYLLSTNEPSDIFLRRDLTFAISAIAKTAIGVWLLFRSTTLVKWLGNWRKLRMDEEK